MRKGAHRRLSPSLETTCSARSHLHARRRGVEPARRVDEHRRLDITSGKTRRVRFVGHRVPVRAGHGAAAAVLSGPHQRLRRASVGQACARTVRPTTSTPGDAHPGRRAAPAQVRRRVPLRHERVRTRSPRERATLQFSRNFTSLSRPSRPPDRRRRQRLRVVPARILASSSVTLIPTSSRTAYTRPFCRTLAAVEPPDAERRLRGTRGAHPRDGQPVNAGSTAATALLCAACPASGLPAELRGASRLPTARSTRAIGTTSARESASRIRRRRSWSPARYGLTYLDSSTDRGTHIGFPRVTPYVASLDSNRTPSGRLANPYPSGLLQPAGSGSGRDGARYSDRLSHRAARSRIPPVVGRRPVPLPWRSVLECRT